jgi:hypothetical protein
MKTAANALAAFDSLVGNETSNSRHPVIEAAHTITQETQDKSAALDINVADAEALFGAAEARQNSLATRPATTKNARTSNKDISRTTNFTGTKHTAPKVTSKAELQRQKRRAVPFIDCGQMPAVIGSCFTTQRLVLRLQPQVISKVMTVRLWNQQKIKSL